MFKLKSLKHFNKILDFQTVFYCHNRNVLLIFSLLCTIIVLTQQAVAFPKPQTSSSNFSFSAYESLPQVSGSGIVEDETTFNQDLDVLTPGQQVINAVPDKERGDFVMYELAIALKKIENEENEINYQRRLRNLENVKEFYEKNLTVLENVPFYENFSKDLLQWIQQELNLTHQNIYYQLRSRSQLLCTSEGVCYNPKNIGCYCCPF
ncbi:uncharacterized protein ACRADG_003490 [Cochliomyia hominivorax]